MSQRNDWWTCPTESEDGRLIIVSGRRDIDDFRKNPKFNIRVEITWRYSDAPDATMPDDSLAQTMGEVTDALNAELDKDPVAVMTGIYTGAGERNWVFYTLSTNIFNKKLNQALAPFPMLPLSIYAENDPDWLEYAEMRDLSEITTED
ncbi:MAG: DUF695 domain-containing protein [Muribaculaceae bacterium]|nr:DUF695 domain-containing protein [Muribaculaceae bacterium]MDE7458332.1 DUF695 domain-containing protein [Muribaculaceae bacterium]